MRVRVFIFIEDMVFPQRATLPGLETPLPFRMGREYRRPHEGRREAYSVKTGGK